MHLESLPLDADRRALQCTDVLPLIHAESGRWNCPCPPVHLLDALPCIDRHPERDTGDCLHSSRDCEFVFRSVSASKTGGSNTSKTIQHS